jgi:hypothetical protein
MHAWSYLTRLQINAHLGVEHVDLCVVALRHNDDGRHALVSIRFLGGAGPADVEILPSNCGSLHQVAFQCAHTPMLCLVGSS